MGEVHRVEAQLLTPPNSSMSILNEEDNCHCSIYWPPRCYCISDKIKILFTGGAVFFAQITYTLSGFCAGAAGVAYSLQENADIDTTQVVTPLWIASIGLSATASATLVFRNLFCRTTVEINAAQNSSLPLNPASQPLTSRNITNITDKDASGGRELEEV